MIGVSASVWSGMSAGGGAAPGSPFDIASITATGDGSATVTTLGLHGLATGDGVTIDSGLYAGDYAGVTVVSTTTYALPAPYVGDAPGSTWAAFSFAAAGAALVTAPTAHWRLGEAYGKVRRGSVGAELLSDVGSVGVAAGPASGPAADFSGSNYLFTPSYSAIDPSGGAFSLAFWVRPAAIGGLQGCVSKDSNSNPNRDFSIFVNGSGQIQMLFWDAGAGLTLYLTTATVTAAAWNHVVVRYDGTNALKVSVNGVHETANASFGATGLHASDQPIMLGTQDGTQRFLAGRLADVALWKGHYLSDQEVADLYNSGTGRVYPYRSAVYAAIQLSEPQAYQTRQRSGSTGSIAVAGHYQGSPSGVVQARFRGGSWATVDASPANGRWAGTLSSQGQGQGPFEVRFAGATSVRAYAQYVGIGDVFLVVGQSNAVGQGTHSRSYSHATLKAALLKNSYQWSELLDPTDDPTRQADTVSLDTTYGGSYWPLLATSILADQSGPVAFIPCALGGTTILQWQPGADHLDRTTLYGLANYRAQLAGGVKAALMHQGESDAQNGTSQATYNSRLDSLANAIYTDLGVPLIPTLLQSCFSDVSVVNAGIAEAVADNPHVPVAADLSDLTVDDGGYHLTADATLAAAAARWWTAIKAEFY